MKIFFNLLVLLFLITGCAPGEIESPSTPSTSPSSTITIAFTETPLPTITPSPVPTIALPVGNLTPMPSSESQISKNNLPELEEISLYYGDTVFVSAFTQDGDLLFVRNPMGLDIYNFNTKELISHLDLWGPWFLYYAFGEPALSLQVSLNGEWALADGRWLVNFFSGKDPEITDLWSRFPLEKDHNFQNFSLSPDGRIIIMADLICDYNGCSKDGNFISINLPDLQVVYSWIGGYGDLHGRNPVFSSDGSLIATRVDNQIVVWEVSSKTQVTVVKSIQGDSKVVFSNDNSLIAIGQIDTLQIWDVLSGENVQTIKGVCGELYGAPQPISLTANEIIVWECPLEEQGTFSAWAIADGSLIYKNDFGNISPSQLIYENDEISLLENPRNPAPWSIPRIPEKIQFLENGDLVFSQRDDRLRNVTCVITPESKASCFEDVLLGLDEQFYHYVTENNIINFYKGFTKSDDPLYSLNLKDVRVKGFDPVNGLLFYDKWTTPNSSNVNIMNVNASKVVTEWKNSNIQSMVVSSDKEIAVICRKDATFGTVIKVGIDQMTIYDLSNMNAINHTPFTCLQGFGLNTPMALTADGGKLATAYSYVPGVQIQYLIHHELLIMDTLPPRGKQQRIDVGCESIRALKFTPDDSVLILACGDGTLRFLDSGTVSEIYRIDNIDPDVWGLAISKDGNFLAMVSKRGSVSVWAVPPFDYTP